MCSSYNWLTVGDQILAVKVDLTATGVFFGGVLFRCHAVYVGPTKKQSLPRPGAYYAHHICVKMCEDNHAAFSSRIVKR